MHRKNKNAENATADLEEYATHVCITVFIHYVFHCRCHSVKLRAAGFKMGWTVHTGDRQIKMRVLHFNLLKTSFE